MNSQHAILIEVLARTDALFTPFRYLPDRQRPAAAVFERRGLFPAGGIALPAGDHDADQRARERLVARLWRERLIERGGGRAVRLTDSGEHVARSLSAGYPLAASWQLLDLIAGMDSPGPILERYILGYEATGHVPGAEVARLEALALPALLRGWLATNSDSQSCIGYSVTEAGRAAVAAGAPTPPAGLPAYSQAAGDHYDKIYHSELQERERWVPRVSGHLFIPLSNGGWPDPPANWIGERLFQETAS